MKNQEFLSSIFNKDGKERKWKEYNKKLPTKEDIKKKKMERKRIERSKSHKLLKKKLEKSKIIKREFIKTNISGFDKLLEKGIPKGVSVLVAGGPGTGKTIFCLEMVAKAAKEEKKCLYISFEESEERLKDHINEFGLDWEEAEKKKLLLIKRFDPFKLSRTVEAMLAEAKGELLIETGISNLFPENFKPDIIVLDSISALAAAFSQKDETYRIYIEQLFRYFEKIGANSFFISETQDAPKKFSESGVEEFLADGVIVMYYLQRENIRERAMEILKMRGAAHEKKIVAMQITSKGIIIYPDQEVFAEVEQ